MKARAYATLCGAKGDPTGVQKFYQIFFDIDKGPLSLTQAWHGPYRDKTDAENAAHDEADRRGLELEWVN